MPPVNQFFNCPLHAAAQNFGWQGVQLNGFIAVLSEEGLGPRRLWQTRFLMAGIEAFDPHGWQIKSPDIAGEDGQPLHRERPAAQFQNSLAEALLDATPVRIVVADIKNVLWLLNLAKMHGDVMNACG